MASSVAEIEHDLAGLRDAATAPDQPPNLRTSVLTHLAWVPPEWQAAAEETLAGLAERHPSRTILLFPQPDEADGWTWTRRCSASRSRTSPSAPR